MRSLVALTLLLVGGVVLLLGAGVVTWITKEDLVTARRDARRQQEAAEEELRALAGQLLAEAQDAADGLVEGGARRMRQWIREEPFEIYRDVTDPTRPDTTVRRQEVYREVGQRSLDELDHVAIVTEVMADHAEDRIARATAELEASAADQAEEAARTRRLRLALRLGLLLLGMAALLVGTLLLLVVRPLSRLRQTVRRIAGGDLATPVPDGPWPAREMSAFAGDVERMRDQIRAATEDLEAEVDRKTQRLAATLDERTRALEELRTTRDRLIQAEKMAGLGTLAGGVAHEFNNLLGGILGCIESARQGTDDDSVREDLDMARRTAERATGLVDALLGVTRPGGRGFEPVRLRDVVEDVLAAAGATLRHRDVEVARELDADPVVEGDAGQLHQVVLNLVTNALQSVDDGERLAVALRLEDGQALLEVRDGGPGIAPEDRSRIFEPFFTGRRDGTGLGLFLSYGIVERHGGRIEVGDAPEGGARLTVRIPGARPYPS